ncbi:hypothetical protein B0T18DRAFT_78410 [Schizothecium vesticola]|uniref:MalT-like TPR region domain-containing protein n=1 Tax=Schizothecium vesticola TaxID=314040 RepID=A0AA40F694_9PEZI|nr:hypothetical protein B0T18DRAFT_78410 [Schizothecium vesticola]
MTEQFLMHIGPGHLETMGLLLTSSAILKHQRRYFQASARLDQLLLLYEQSFGPYSYQASHALADHAAIKTEMGNFEDAKALITEAMDRADKIRDVAGCAEGKIRCLVNLSTLCEAKGEVAQMHQHLALALSIGKEHLDEAHWMIRHVGALIAAAPAVPQPLATIWSENSSLVSFSSDFSCILTPESDSSGFIVSPV